MFCTVVQMAAFCDFLKAAAIYLVPLLSNRKFENFQKYPSLFLNWKLLNARSHLELIWTIYGTGITCNQPQLLDFRPFLSVPFYKKNFFCFLLFKCTFLGMHINPFIKSNLKYHALWSLIAQICANRIKVNLKLKN